MSSGIKEGTTQPIQPGLAYDACLPEMQRLQLSQIQAVNLDVMEAVRTVRGYSERLSGLRSAAESAFNNFNLSLWDKLEIYTFALIHAHEAYVCCVSSCAVPVELVNEAQRNFELLYAVAQTLVSRRLLGPEILKRAKVRRGRLRYAYGSLQLVEHLRAHWAALAGKTGLTEDELTHAELAAERLASGIAKRREPKERAEQLANLRDRAFTLFIYAYGQVRRAVQYLRWDFNDADAFAPSLYRRRHKRRTTTRKSIDSATTLATISEDSATAQHQEQEPESGGPDTDGIAPAFGGVADNTESVAMAKLDRVRRKRAYAKRKSHKSVARFRSRMRAAQ